jgi:hypothetical protein
MSRVVIHLANGSRVRVLDSPGERLRGLMQATGRTSHRDMLAAQMEPYMHGTKEAATPLYAAYPLTQVSHDALAGWCAMWGLPLVMDPHVTVAYTRKPIMASRVPKTSAGMVVPPGGRSIERFGDSIVLCLDCDELQARHADYVKAGASWDYPSYRPHITLAHADVMGPTSEDLIPPYDEPITLDAETRSPILSQSDLAT